MRTLALALTLVLSLSVSVPARAAVDETNANRLNALGLFLGTGSGYDLGGTATRLHGIIMLTRMLGEEDAALSFDGPCPFSDVAAGKPSAYTGYAFAQGYTTGVSTTTFRPNGDLYFSSNGHGGLGGLDIFIAKIGKDGQYHLSHPGYPLNSSGDDFGMTFIDVHNRGYFSSNRNDGRGYDHIYSFDNPEIIQTITGWVYEAGGYELPAAEVRIVGDDGTNQKTGVRSDGSFRIVGKPGVSYLLMASCKGFLNHQEQVTLDAHPKESSDTTLQFALANISAPVLIDNIFYDFDKATLRDTSKVALDKLVATLKENPNVTIELAAHCDYKGSAEYNKRLSQRRAESVVDYLIAHGISADRLTPVGYGKDKPWKVSKRQTERYPWLKEGTELTEAFITALKDQKQQEICNQLNRRTEFSVLRTTYGMFDEKGRLKNPPKQRKQETQSGDSEFYFGQ